MNAADAGHVLDEKEVVAVGGDPRRIADGAPARPRPLGGEAFRPRAGDVVHDAVRRDLPDPVVRVGKVDVPRAVEGHVAGKGDGHVERRPSLAVVAERLGIAAAGKALDRAVGMDEIDAVRVVVDDVRVPGAVEDDAVVGEDHRLRGFAEGVVVEPDAGDRRDAARCQRVEPRRHVEEFAVRGAGGVADGDDDVAVVVRRHRQADLRVALRQRRDRGAVEGRAGAGEARAADGDDRPAGDRALRGREGVDARRLREDDGAEEDQQSGHARDNDMH